MIWHKQRFFGLANPVHQQCWCDVDPEEGVFLCWVAQGLETVMEASMTMDSTKLDEEEDARKAREAEEHQREMEDKSEVLPAPLSVSEGLSGLQGPPDGAPQLRLRLDALREVDHNPVHRLVFLKFTSRRQMLCFEAVNMEDFERWMATFSVYDPNLVGRQAAYTKTPSALFTAVDSTSTIESV